MNAGTGKTTLVIGASENPGRYAYMAVNMLKAYKHPVLALGKQKGKIDGTVIETDINAFKNSQIDTVSLYLNKNNQEKLYQDIIALRPKRVIFNPGTENSDFEELLDAENIPHEDACTLVLLRIGQF